MMVPRLKTTIDTIIFIILIAIVVMSPTKALSFDVVPPLESMLPISSSIDRTAFIAAQRAFFIQTGAQHSYETLKRAVNNKISFLENKAYSLLDDTPINKDHFLIVVGGLYTIAIKKHYQSTFKNPLNKSVNHYIKWNREVAETGITLQF